MSSILPLAAFHGESGPRRHYAGVARISGMDVVRLFGTSKPHRRRRHFKPSMRSHLIPYNQDSGLWEVSIKRGFKRFLDQRLELLRREFEREAGMKMFRRD